MNAQNKFRFYFTLALIPLILAGCGRNVNTLVSDLLQPTPPPQIEIPHTYENSRRFIEPAANTPYDIVIFVDSSLTTANAQALSANIGTLFSFFTGSRIAYHLTFLDTTGTSQGPNAVISSTDANPTSEAVADLTFMIARIGTVPTTAPTDVLLSAFATLNSSGFFRANSYRTFLIFSESTAMLNTWSEDYLRNALTQFDQDATPLNWTMSVMNFNSDPTCSDFQNNVESGSVNFDLSGLVQMGGGIYMDCSTPSSFSAYLTSLITTITAQQTQITIRDMIQDPLNIGVLYPNFNYETATVNSGTYLYAGYDYTIDTVRWVLELETAPPAPGSTIDVDFSLTYFTLE